MQDNNLYNSSSFFENMDGELGNQFTDFTPIPCQRPWLTICRARRFGQWWIIKGTNPTFPSQEKAQQLIDKEFSQGIMLWHPNIARMIAQQEVPTMTGRCIIEEWVDGVSLDKFLLTMPNSDVRLDIAKQLIEAVRYSTNKGIVHGNLKPSNILITRNGANVKIIDFEPYSNETTTDLYALAALMQQLKLPSKYNKLIKRCKNGIYLTSDKLYQDFHNITSSSSWRWVIPSLFILIASTAIAATFLWGNKQQKDDNSKLPPGYVLDSIPPGANVTFSTISLADIYYLGFDSITPGNIPDTMAVDLGLSVKWSKMNMGSSHPSVNFVGSFYCWGDTTDMTKWGGLDSHWPSERSMPTTSISGTNIDFAHMRWGGKWRLPTIDEFRELINQCSWKFRNPGDGAAGYVVTGPNGNSIFIHLAGWSDDGINYQNIGRYGYYWTATPDSNGKRMAHYILVDESKIICDKTHTVNCLMAIRPVMDK